MILLTLIRYLHGFVKFRVQGAFIERFLNLAARDRIPIWNGKKRKDVYTGHTTPKSYRRLRPHAKKSGVTLRVVEKHGLPFKRRRYRKRTGLLTGLGVFFALIFLTGRFIWRVEVSGNQRIPEHEIISVLDKIGVNPGVLRSSVDVRGAERRVLLALEDLSWIALNIKGSTVYAVVRERDLKPPMVDPKVPCNVIAARSGQITAMVVYEGQAVKAVGDAVLEGEMLASGITEDRLGQNLFRHARARVMARVQHQITVETPLAQTEFIETGEIRARRFFHVLGWDLPLFLPQKIPFPYHVQRGQKFLIVAGNALPVGVFTERYVLMEEVPVTYTEDQARREGMRELEARQKAELDGAKMIDRKIKGSLKDGVFILKAEYICDMDIALEKRILKSE